MIIRGDFRVEPAKILAGKFRKSPIKLQSFPAIIFWEQIEQYSRVKWTFWSTSWKFEAKYWKMFEITRNVKFFGQLLNNWRANCWRIDNDSSIVGSCWTQLRSYPHCAWREKNWNTISPFSHLLPQSNGFSILKIISS